MCAAAYKSKLIVTPVTWNRALLQVSMALYYAHFMLSTVCAHKLPVDTACFDLYNHARHATKYCVEILLTNEESHLVEPQAKSPTLTGE
jgi:hypothetical protein